METHIRRGEVDPNALPLPQKAEALHVHSSCDLLWTMLRDSAVDVGQQDESNQDISNDSEEALASFLSYGEQKLFGLVAKGHASPDGNGMPAAVAGHTGILPKNKNCISLLKPFQDNLTVAPRGLKAFPLRPELLLPISFPRHDLIGLNHRALEDTLQTRLLALAFDELCKPTEERNENWRPEHLVPVTQTSIMDFYQRQKDLPLDPHLSQLDT